MARKLKEVILNQFVRRFGEIEHSFLLAASTLLDPRFKRIHFQDQVALSTALSHIRAELKTLDRTDDSTESLSDTSSNLEEEFDIWQDHKSLVHKRRRRDIDSTDPTYELSFYLNAPVLELNRNVIDAWEEMKTVYPKLYLLSKKYCYLLGTSVPAERIFSEAGATATEFLNSIMNN